MSKADTIFINMCQDILQHGTTTENEKVRPHWPDGTSAYTCLLYTSDAADEPRHV